MYAVPRGQKACIPLFSSYRKFKKVLKFTFYLFFNNKNRGIESDFTEKSNLKNLKKNRYFVNFEMVQIIFFLWEATRCTYTSINFMPSTLRRHISLAVGLFSVWELKIYLLLAPPTPLMVHTRYGRVCPKIFF
jgi:hypothetical protein